MLIDRRRAYGFTLVETMIVIAIMGIVMAIAVPSIKTLLNNQKMKSATFDLVTTAMLARSEAIKWGGSSSATISIRAPSDNFSSNGWCIVFTSTETCSTSAPGDAVMQIIKPPTGVTYTYQGTSAPVTFTRNGRITNSTAVKFLVTDNDAFAQPRCVKIDTNGNATVTVLSAGATSC